MKLTSIYYCLLFLCLGISLHGQEEKNDYHRLAIQGFYESEELLTSSKAYHDKLFDEVNPFDPEGLLDRALEKFKSDFLDEALEDVKEAIRLYPRYGGAYLLQGAIYEEKGAKELAKRSYHKALEFNPLLTMASNQLGCLYALEEELDSARQVLTVGIARTSAYPLLHYNLGVVELYDENPRKAIKHLQGAVARDSCFMHAHAVLIVAQDMQGNRRQALIDAERAMICDEEVADLYVVKGMIQYFRGKHVAAIEELSAAIALEPNHRYAHFLRALALTLINDYKAAIKELKATFRIPATGVDSNLMWKHDEDFGVALKYYEEDRENLPPKVNKRLEKGICTFFLIGGSSAAITYFQQALDWTRGNCMSCHYFLGIAFEEIDMTKEAEKHYSEAIVMAPQIYELYQRRGAVSCRDSKWAAAVKDYDKMLTMRPDDKRPHKQRGMVHMQLKKYNFAILDYSAFLQQSDTVDMQVLYDRALCYKEIKYYDNAIKDLSQVLQKQKKDLEAYYERAYCYYMNGDAEKSKIDLDSVLLTNSDYPKAHNLRGVVLMDEGNFQGAIYHFNQALDQRPSYKEACFNKYLAFKGMEQYENALLCMEELIDLDRKNGLYYFHRGYVKKQLGMASACRDVKKALDLGLKVEQEAIEEVCAN